VGGREAVRDGAQTARIGAAAAQAVAGAAGERDVPRGTGDAVDQLPAAAGALAAVTAMARLLAAAVGVDGAAEDFAALAVPDTVAPVDLGQAGIAGRFALDDAAGALAGSAAVA